MEPPKIVEFLDLVIDHPEAWDVDIDPDGEPCIILIDGYDPTDRG